LELVLRPIYHPAVNDDDKIVGIYVIVAHVMANTSPHHKRQ
jgi:hypothetical protein